MSTIQLRLHGTAPRASHRPLGRRAARLLASARGILREWRERSRGRQEIATLDDRSLRDIGLTRSEAEFVANKPFWRE